MNLLALDRESRMKNLKMTILFRSGGTWNKLEVGRLINGLMTETSQHPQHPEHMILFGHHTKEETLKALLGGPAYTAEQVTGLHDPKLPFTPSFIS